MHICTAPLITKIIFLQNMLSSTNELLLLEVSDRSCLLILNYFSTTNRISEVIVIVINCSRAISGKQYYISPLLYTLTLFNNHKSLALFNWSIKPKYTRVVDILIKLTAQSARASTSDLCQTERHGFEPRLLTVNFVSTEHLVQYEFPVVFYL